MLRQTAFFCLAAAVLFGASLARVGPAPADQGGIPHVAGEVIIKFKNNASQQDKDQVRAELGGTKLKGWGRIKAELRRLGEDLTVEQAIQRYQNHPKVQYIEPNFIVSADEIPNDPLFPQLWGMQNTGQTGGTPGADISATSAWDISTGSDEVLVGVIDTGIDYNHPDLAANIWTNPGEIPNNGIDDDNNGFIDDIHGWDFYNDDNDPMDDNGHGTHVSGTIGGIGNNGIGVVGVNWNIRIMGLKFLSAGGSGSTADAVDAMDYATMMGVRLTSNSWGGGGFSQALLDAIEAANAAGQLFVAAAGNSGINTDLSPHYPSSYDSENIVSVTAVDHNDTQIYNYGVVTVDLAAPGVGILSTIPGNAYGTSNGTSMATPHVSGALGLVFSVFPNIGHLDAKSLILDNVDVLPGLQGLVLTGGRLNAFLPIAEPDSIPPGMINDLAIATTASNWLGLQWTATGDDGDVGTASRYEVRYSTAPIDDTNWDAAGLAPNPPDPGPSGTTESMSVAGLDFSTNYYVAVKAFDEFGNEGPISNVPSAMTLGEPEVDVDPTSLAETLLTGATATQTLTLSNLAPNTTLDFEIPLPDLVTNPVPEAQFTPLGKGEPDPRVGNPVIEGLGGPDAFGYRWVDSDEPFGPTFNWLDISSSGTPAITTGDDVNSGPFPIGFTFPYYGAEYTEFRVCSNGWLSFTSTSTAYSNQPLPNPGAPQNLIAPFWDDLVIGAGSVYYESDGSQLIVQWDGVDHYSAGGPYTFQAILRSDGSIKYQFLDIGTPDNSATVGIQNVTGTDGLEIAFNTTYVHNNLAVLIQAVPQWLTVVPVEGTVYGVGSTPLTVDFDASGLLGGTYEGNIRVFSNDPDENPFTVPVTLTVIGAPDIEVSPLVHDFGQVFFGLTPSFSFLVSNPGTDTLHVSNVGMTDAAFVPSMTAFDVPPRGDVLLDVTFNPAAVGVYSGTMSIFSDAPLEPEVQVSLAGESVTPPDFNVDPLSLSSALFTGQTDTQQLTITNLGGADLEYSIGIQTEVEVIEYNDIELGKGQEDPGPGILGAGGPDAYGYSWIDSDEPGGPVFSWVDISGIGTPVSFSSSDDSNSGPLPIGFDFPFYGNSFGTLNACTNGWLSFTSTRTNYSNRALPTGGTTYPENLLAPFWDDLHLRLTGQVHYYNDGSRFIVQFTDIERLSSGSLLTFQVILYPSGRIVYQYESLTGFLTSCTVGIQNETRDDGLTVVHNAAYLHDGLAILFSAAPEWLTASPTAGTIPPGLSEIIDVTFNAADLFGGTYQGSVDIATNDPAAPLVQVPATLSVTGAPDITVDPLALDFGQVFVGYLGFQSVTITNEGTDLLTVTDLTTDNPEFFVDFTNLQLPLDLQPFQFAEIGLRFSPSAAGPQTATFTVTSNDGDEAQVPVALQGEGLIPPVAGADPLALLADLLTGETELQQVLLSNTGGSDLTFDIQAYYSGPAEVIPSVDPGLAKGEEDASGITYLGSGGPDNFGYEWRDSDEPGGPVFDWVDITGVGTPVFSGNADDVNEGPFPVGFDFPFYENSFSTFRVSSNGFITFTSTSSDLGNSTLPGTGGPENLLAIYWDDMYVDADIPSQVYYHNDGSRLIVQFNNVRRYGQSDQSPPFYTFEAILYPNGTIVYQYLSVGTTNNSSTQGFQNAARDDGLTIAYNEPYVHPQLAVRISALPEWLRVQPISGVVTPGQVLPLQVTIDATDLFGGDYEGGLRILSNDPANGLIDVTCNMHVTGVPRIGFNPADLAFGDVYIGYPETLPLTVSNIGTDHLSVNSIMPGLPDYSAVPDMLELDPLESAEILVTFDPTTDGDRGTMLTFVSNDPDSPHMMPLSGTGVIPPLIGTSPDPLYPAAPPGGAKTMTLTVCNTGGSDLVFTVAAAEATASSVPVYEYLELPKGQDVPGAEIPEDPRPGLLGTGGPDMYGYVWTDSDEPGGPTFDWVDISGVGTPVGFPSYQDDGNVGPSPIGFDFPFYGQTFNEFYVCSNGWVSFTNSTLTTYSNQPLPNSGSAVPENLLAAYWDDMVYDESDLSEVVYHYDGTRLILQIHVRRIADFTPPHYLFQVILYPNGDIVYQYHTLGTNTTSCTIGIQNQAKDDGLTVVHNEAYVHEQLAIRFSAAPAWLSVSPEAGVVPAGECMDLTVVADACELETGTYNGSIDFSSNDPANPMWSNGVTFHVGTTDADYADVDPNTLNLGNNGRWINAIVQLPGGYAPSDVLAETVFMTDSWPPSGCFSLPPDPHVPANRMEVGDFNEDGVPDLQFKFDRALVEDLLVEGEAVAVYVVGEVEGMTWFVAMDQIRVIRPHMDAPNGGEQLIAGQTYEVRWTNPDGWAVLSSTLIYSADGGENWVMVAENITDQQFTWTVPGEPTEAGLLRVFALDDQGVMGYDTCDQPFAVTGSAVGVESVLPTVHALHQNAPNPFRGATRIAFDLPDASPVALKVFDVSGRVVRVLADGVYPAGNHQIGWDGRNEAGRGVASGIYFYQIQAGEFTATKRMFLMQ